MNRVALENNWGVIRFDFSGDDALTNVAYLLRDAVAEYARCNIRFSQTIDDLDFPIGYGELQNHGVMFHSFYHALTSSRKNQGAVFSEYQFKLNKYRYRDQPEDRRIDFWVLLTSRNKDDTALFVEYKHRWASVRKYYLYEDWADKENKRVLSLGSLVRDWEQDIKKLGEKAVRYSNVRQPFRSYEAGKCRVVTVMLMTVPVCQDSLEKGNLETVCENDFAIHREEVFRRSRPKLQPNWKAYWCLPEGQQKKGIPWNDDDGQKHYFYYRGMYFFARFDMV